MGRNLALNMTCHGCALADYVEDQAKVEALNTVEMQFNALGRNEE